MRNKSLLEFLRKGEFEFDDVFEEELKIVTNRKIPKSREKQEKLQKNGTLPNADFKKRGTGLLAFQDLLPPQNERSPMFNKVIEKLASKKQNKKWAQAAKDQTDTGLQRRAKHDGLVGLALSGGGIRSATFNLGILQALQRIGLFRCIDYLSTVSGGGFIGACLSSCLKSNPKKFPFEHVQGKPEPAPFRHLRNNANYLAPKGWVDRLRIPALLVRGITVNFLVILPYILVAVFITVVTNPTPSDLKINLLGEIIGWGKEEMHLRTLVLSGFLLALFALYPIIRIIGGSKAGIKWGTRDRAGKILGFGLGLVIFVAFAESQPVAIYHFQETLPNVKDKFFSNQEWLTIMGGLISLISVMFSGRFIRKDSGLSGKIGLWVIAILGFVFFWLIYLNLCRWAIYSETTPSWLLKIDSFFPWYFFSISDLFVSVDLKPRAVARVLDIYIISGIAIWFYTMLFVDVNSTSMHNFYRDRLSRAYLFNWTDNETSHNDKIRLNELEGVYSPYHLINTALNLPGLRAEKDSDYRRGRSADFFIFSKLFIGGPKTGYCRTRFMEILDRHVNLGTAMAISGAAAAANMGKATVKQLVFILGMLNVRLNYWLYNPQTVNDPKSRVALFLLGSLSRVGPFYLLMELVGITRFRRKSGHASRVNVSDGGHIENLGIYELLRRECRLIVAGDGECDPNFEFDGLSEVIRMAQVDLSVRIVMKGLDAIRKGRQQYAVGTIHYGDGREGVLIYLKSSLLKKGQFDSNPYIARYKAEHPAFPHEKTADQFFDESQFECYRALGFDVAMKAFWRN